MEGILTVVFFLCYGLSTLWGVPYTGLIAGICALVLGVFGVVSLL